ncbi:hypothetical protein PGTUg99_011833 [Puccinia graminis f. sp. tritici]|uniref:Uncharacterized protein n=1 Tax=Puccinia graminis f. sp. tritici TaxID=56615 RepID=A0A5B0LJA8_PUCGR|nr:hypothetical protein PGTUg99_011833 [Puccinia graminis f. sp. tritici]
MINVASARSIPDGRPNAERTWNSRSLSTSSVNRYPSTTNARGCKAGLDWKHVDVTKLAHLNLQRLMVSDWLQNK